MPSLADQFGALRDDPDVALLLDTYAELEQVYQASLATMGQRTPPTPSVRNSAEVTFAHEPSPSTVHP